MSTTPSPSGWVIPNPDAQDFSFTSSLGNVSSLSDQALQMNPGASPNPIILPSNSSGGIEQMRVDCALALAGTTNSSAGIVFAYQDIDNYLSLETKFKEYAGEVSGLAVHEKVNGSLNQLVNTGSNLSVNAYEEWVDLRFQVFRPTSSELSVRVSAADHGNTYQSLGTKKFSNSELPFTIGDVGLSCGHWDAGSDIAFDGDPVGSGNRPIKMYWQ